MPRTPSSASLTPYYSEELSQSSNVNDVFSLLAHMHSLNPPVHLLGEPRPAIFPYIDRLVDSALKSNSASEDLKKRIVNAKLIFDQKVIPALLALNSPVVFAHNDAQVVFRKNFLQFFRRVHCQSSGGQRSENERRHSYAY